MTIKKLKSIDIINVLSDLVSEKMETTVKLPSLSSLEEVEGDYDALYLSPSVMHLKGDIESIVSVPVYVIDPLVYATNDFYTLIHTILSK